MAYPKVSSLRLMLRISEQRQKMLGRQLADIRLEERGIMETRADLLRQEDQAFAANIVESAPYLAGFLRSLKARRAALDQREQDLATRAAKIETDLQAAYQETESYNAVIRRILKDRAYEAARKEAAELDEVAANMFMFRA